MGASKALQLLETAGLEHLDICLEWWALRNRTRSCASHVACGRGPAHQLHFGSQPNSRLRKGAGEMGQGLAVFRSVGEEEGELNGFKPFGKY